MVAMIPGVGFIIISGSSGSSQYPRSVGLLIYWVSDLPIKCQNKLRSCHGDLMLPFTDATNESGL